MLHLEFYVSKCQIWKYAYLSHAKVGQGHKKSGTTRF